MFELLCNSDTFLLSYCCLCVHYSLLHCLILMSRVYYSSCIQLLDKQSRLNYGDLYSVYVCVRERVCVHAWLILACLNC